MTQAVLYGSHEPDPKDVEALFADVEDVLTNYTLTEPFAEGYTGTVETKDIEMRKYLGDWAFKASRQKLYMALGEITGHLESTD